MSDIDRLLSCASEEEDSHKECTIPEYFPSLRAYSMADFSLELTAPMDSLIPFPDKQQLERPLPPVTQVTTEEFMQIVEDVREAISLGIQPILISKGSSGSYFCRNKFGEIVGVFKPKDEEPYGHMNPKFIKWIHRNIFPCCFGRDGLIPNLGYISEAAASFIDARLGLGVVPRTEIVCLSSPVFSYTSLQRRASLGRFKPLPPKIGSFQLFVRGYTEAASSFFAKGYDKLNISSQTFANEETPKWTDEDKQKFRLYFERMVILDYLIRQTDRSMDNWMIKDLVNDSNEREISIAAIDNGLAFPFKHPDSIRSYPYCWSLLPCSNIPFSTKTKYQILPFLTSQSWWNETYSGLHLLFSLDEDFSESKFTKQLSVIRGQSLNLIEILNRCESPAALVRRTLVTVVEETETGLALFKKKGKESYEKVKRKIKTWKTSPLFTSC